MCRKTFAIAFLILCTQASTAFAYDSYSIWWRKCPGTWRLEHVVNTAGEANSIATKWKQQYGSSGYYFAVVGNTNGSRKQPNFNPCSGNGGGNNGGGNNGGCGNVVDQPYHTVHYYYNGWKTYQHYCCRSNAQSVANQLKATYNVQTAVQTNSFRTYGNRQCSPNTIRCSNGIVSLVPNTGAIYQWGCP